MTERTKKYKQYVEETSYPDEIHDMFIGYDPDKYNTESVFTDDDWETIRSYADSETPDWEEFI